MKKLSSSKNPNGMFMVFGLMQATRFVQPAYTNVRGRVFKLHDGASPFDGTPMKVFVVAAQIPFG